MKLSKVLEVLSVSKESEEPYDPEVLIMIAGNYFKIDIIGGVGNYTILVAELTQEKALESDV